MFKRIILTLLFLSLSYGLSYGATCNPPQQTVSNVCNNPSCTETVNKQTNGLTSVYRYGKSKPWYYYYIDIKRINNTGKRIGDNLNRIADNYRGSFYINNFCTGSGCSKEEFDLDLLYSYSSNFEVGGEEYVDGLDYFFRNYNKIFSDIRGYNINISLENYIANYLSYSYSNDKGHGVKIRNVCSDRFCNETVESIFYIDDNNRERISIGGKVPFVTPARKEIEIQPINFLVDELKAGEKINVSFSFIDEILGSNCDEFIYNYKITYLYKDGSTSFLEDVFKIDRFGNLIDTGNEGVTNVSITDEGYVKIDMDEYLIMNKSGEVDFFFEFTDAFGNNEPKHKINEFPIEIFSKEPESTRSVLKFDTDNYNGDETYYAGDEDIFEAKLYLKDSFGNSIIKQDNGINVFYGGDKSEYTYAGDKELSYDEFNRLQEAVLFLDKTTNNFSESLSGVKPEEDIETGEFFYRIQFKFIETGSFKKKFGVKVINNDSNGEDIEGSFTTIYVSDAEKSDYSIAPSGKSEVINIQCAYQVKLQAVCIFDKDSGCKTELGPKSQVTFDSEEQNSSTGVLYTYDNSGRFSKVVKHPFLMNHVDRTSPRFVNDGNAFLLYEDQIPGISNQNIVSEFKARSFGDLKFKVVDPNIPYGCRETVKIDYEAFFDGVKTQSGSIDTQIANIIINPPIDNNGYSFFEKTGKNKNFKLVVYDQVRNSFTFEKEFNIYPSDIFGPDADDFNITIEKANSLLKYADGNNKYRFIITLKDEFDNSIVGKVVKKINQVCTDEYIGCNTLTANEPENSGADVLFEEGYINEVSDSDGIINFTMRSLVPGLFSHNFNLEFEGWNDDNTPSGDIKKFNVSTTGKNYSFLTPIGGTLETADGSDPEVGVLQKYLMSLSYVKNSLNIVFDDGEIDFNDNSISFLSPHKWKFVTPIINKFGDTLDTQLSFSGTIDVLGIASSIEMEADRTILTYNLEHKKQNSSINDNTEVSYYLTGSSLDGCVQENMGIEIIGSMQGDGKGEIVGQGGNFSDISKSELRSQIRSNAYGLIKNRTEGIVDRVKYVSGNNITISGDISDYDTLIVKNGNVIIDGNLNSSKKQLGIIVLKDNYRVFDDYNKVGGNIYVNNNVSHVNAIMYADGVFRSSKANGDSYPDSNLGTPLTIFGTLFTRNTIGGSVTGNNTYTLPGGQETDDYTIADVYDLINLRKVTGCNDSSLIIEYDPSIQTNPPKGFTSN